MAKLIVNPNECAWQSTTVRIKKGHIYVPRCDHTRGDHMPCTVSRNFPDDCPLQEGTVKPKEQQVKYYWIWSTIFHNSKIRVHTTIETANKYCEEFQSHGYDACVKLDKNQRPDTTTGALLPVNPK